jgi:uncharacterized protein (TIGR03083 family)
MDETRWQDVERERLSLADTLESLTPPQWESPSLCARWRVRDVAAHVAMSPVPEPSMSTLVASLVRARGRLWDAAAEIAIDYARRPPAEISHTLREVANSRAMPRITNPENLLMDLLVHGQDIAVPLGIERPMPTEAAVAGFERVWAMGWPFPRTTPDAWCAPAVHRRPGGRRCPRRSGRPRTAGRPAAPRHRAHGCRVGSARRRGRGDPALALRRDPRSPVRHGKRCPPRDIEFIMADEDHAGRRPGIRACAAARAAGAGRGARRPRGDLRCE